MMIDDGEMMIKRFHTLHSRVIVLGYGGGSVLCGSIGQCWTGLT